MLILTRKAGESLIIDDDIKVTILEAKGGNVKIGIDAPQEVDVIREELYERGVRRVTKAGCHRDDVGEK